MPICKVFTISFNPQICLKFENIGDFFWDIIRPECGLRLSGVIIYQINPSKMPKIVNSIKNIWF
jgi:hypothetical protein